MAFDKAITAIPTEIADISITLTDYVAAGEEAAYQSARYSVQVLYGDGEIKVMTGNLVPHLTQAQIDGLMGFLGDLRIKADTEILP